jgi:hypothetical protein
MAREGGSRFFLYIYVEGDGRRRGLISFYKFIMRVGGGGLEEEEGDGG